MKWISWGAVIVAWSCCTAAAAQPQWADGTLLFLANCNSIVERSTHGEIGHVALLFADGEQPWVYEATPGKVRRIELADYRAELARCNRRKNGDQRIEAVALEPIRPYTSGEIAAMRGYLDAQLGRRYSVKNYVRGKPFDGIHCAELASTALARSGRYSFQDFYKISPQQLYDSLLESHLSPQPVELPTPESESWCARSARRWRERFAWCGWSCREAWLFCW